MDMVWQERASDSPYVERVWHSQSDQAGLFLSIAQVHYNVVVTRHRGTTTMTVRGPETRATPAYCPADAEFCGILFSPGTFIRPLPAAMVMDRRDANLPEATSRSFWLDGSAWQYPDYDNAEVFVDRLVRAGLLVHEPVVGSALRGPVSDLSLRSVQRRFQRATGLTYSALRQIERARYATTLLRQGVSILDVVHGAGYADQSHLTRALKHRVGQTPAQLLSTSRRKPMSLLFKTRPIMAEYAVQVR
jgi:AraC-like DNA-binding protein